MHNWKLLCSKINLENTNSAEIKKIVANDIDNYGIYADSINVIGKACFFIAKEMGSKVLVILGNTEDTDLFKGNSAIQDGISVKVCEMNNENCKALWKLFPYTFPVSHKGKPITVGLGDRLGEASPGHIRVVKDKPVFPVLAQQSIRELNLTGRTYPDVLAAASWAVFQEGYTKGFGADGDHMKTADEVKMALDCGFTMITLDCSEQIDNAAATISAEEVGAKYGSYVDSEKSRLELTYMDKSFTLKSGDVLKFDTTEFKRIILIYQKAIRHAIDIFNNLIKKCCRDIDFEMSIDETLCTTTPEAHYLVAKELINAGVEITSLAPRFCGEFQKGIDYRGNIKQFEKEFNLHVKIAEHFGYKVSVHSGSDKFSVFPIIGRLSKGNYHLKTAGTNWLEAMRVIAVKNPSLYRSMHKFSLANLAEAKKYYHISADPSVIPDIDKLSDAELDGLFEIDDSRQVIHITYGLLLQAKDEQGKPQFRDEFFKTLNDNEQAYIDRLLHHIGRHLSELMS